LRYLWPLGALCLLTASRWLIAGAEPGSGSTLLSQAVGYGMASGLAELVVTLRQSGPETRVGQAGFAAGVISSSLVVTGPVLAQGIAGQRLNANDSTLALALTAVVVALLTSCCGDVPAVDLTGLLWPGLAGLLGLLLLLPQPAYSGWLAWAGLISMPLLVGTGAFLATAKRTIRATDAPVRRQEVTGGLLVACLVVTGLWFAGSREPHGSGLWIASGLDGLTASLTLLALRRLGAVRWCAQFSLTPLLALLEGLFFLRPSTDLRTWIGVGLLGASAAYQLFAPEQNTERFASAVRIFPRT